MDSVATSPIRNGTIPFTDLVRAGVSTRPVSMPVAGSGFARLENVMGIPAARGDQGYSLTRLKVLDALIARIKGSRDEDIAPDVRADPLERQEQLIEAIAMRIMDDLRQGRADATLTRGFLVDMTA
ncbi:MAG: hypothetical protein EA427_16480 [Spirochaetaceae bacterium]|nr:MAG: hypothetical protein EA427_16480 [Spirochaetaceae bacterium]